MKAKLAKLSGAEHQKNLKIAKKLEETFLFEGYQEYFLNLVPDSSYSSVDITNDKAPVELPTDNPFPNVLCHNDIH